MEGGEKSKPKVAPVKVTRSAGFIGIYNKLSDSKKKCIDGKLECIEKRLFPRGLQYKKFCSKHIRIYTSGADRLILNIIKEDHLEADLLFIEDHDAYEHWYKKIC